MIIDMFQNHYQVLKKITCLSKKTPLFIWLSLFSHNPFTNFGFEDKMFSDMFKIDIVLRTNGSSLASFVHHRLR